MHNSKLDKLKAEADDFKALYDNAPSPYLYEKMIKAAKAYKSELTRVNKAKSTPARQCTIF